MREIKLIAAIDDKRGIAKHQKLPWNIPSDRQYFQDHIRPGPVLMGWNTFVSNGYKPYGIGKNFVLTKENKQYDGVEIIHDLQAFLISFQEDLWIAGGGQVFAQVLPDATKLYLTRLEGDFDCDVFFPEFEPTFRRVRAEEPQVENSITFHYELWVKA
jgi:dihydrofolate reductase